MLCTPRVHTRLHGSTLPAEVISPRLTQLFIALGSFQRGGRQHSLTSETYPPSVTRGQHRTSVQFLTDSLTPQAREWMTPLLQTQDPMGRSVGCGFAPGARRSRDATLHWRLNTQSRLAPGVVAEGSRRRSAKLVRGQRKSGCSPLPTKGARFCSRREEPIGSWSFAPLAVDVEHGEEETQR